MYIDKTISL